MKNVAPHLKNGQPVVETFMLHDDKKINMLSGSLHRHAVDDIGDEFFENMVCQVTWLDGQAIQVKTHKRFAGQPTAQKSPGQAFGLKRFDKEPIMRQRKDIQRQHGVFVRAHGGHCIRNGEKSKRKTLLPLFRLDQPLDVFGQNIRFDIDFVAHFPTAQRGHLERVRNQRHAEQILVAANQRQ